MERSQAVFCSFLLLVLVESLAVQADSPCTRQCPVECAKRGTRAFQCFAICVKQCDLGEGSEPVAKDQPKAPWESAEEKHDKKKHIITSPASKFHEEDSKHSPKAPQFP
ncbi:OLC1v1000829C1 [Oldenlandia corymbosa var. corymbosa]|uniref:OLC1v1000829C1 n=1 Tax=Oldenlandia corymbosa var. corymbosa TaxID=529605 RepID=A0AAV1D3X6_OLDCO|nr:OLC1v1000829C1 [Oldenlandia corymbosa var. corymbosa]